MSRLQWGTLDAPLLVPLADGGYAVCADDAGLPWPRIGDVRYSVVAGWLAWPMGAQVRDGFASRDEAIAHVVAIARAGAGGSAA